MIVIDKEGERIYQVIFGKEQISQKDMNNAVPPLNGFYSGDFESNLKYSKYKNVMMQIGGRFMVFIYFSEHDKWE